ncbi:hypothetical protein G6F63_016209 [Rhizopus arrhizus]|nr:hypothetical protein G6F63_016209 [Rhizopus arrhizus]
MRPAGGVQGRWPDLRSHQRRAWRGARGAGGAAARIGRRAAPGAFACGSHLQPARRAGRGARRRGAGCARAVRAGPAIQAARFVIPRN